MAKSQSKSLKVLPRNKQPKPSLNKAVTIKYNAFWVTRQLIKTRMGPAIPHAQITFKDTSLIELMRDLTEDSAYYGVDPIKRPSDVFCFVNALEARHEDYVKELVKFLNEEFEGERKKLENLLEQKCISFDLLWYLFKKDDDVFYISNGTTQGGRVVSCDYEDSYFGPRRFKATVNTIKSDGRKFRMATETFTIYEFNGVKKHEQLAIVPLDAANRAVLETRGRLFSGLANSASYLQYESHIIWKEWFGIQSYKANGRCMIDQTSFHRQNPRYAQTTREEQEIDVIPDELLFACNAWVAGFSFANKRWGEFCLDALSPVKFNDTAFDTLVLAQETKHMVRSLVEYSGKTFQDVIYGKGGGCIFLLHGPPGTGKTLTAESISEVLHRPLYSVSVGELGTTPEKLETSLRNILEMATIWNATILIDEADIFLESRTDDADIDRNAMVAIFLRLLEYHQGVLFLTTNRVRSFDRAFHSRISIAIEYPTLSVSDRHQIWINLLSSAGVPTDGIDINRLSTHPVNGRQIKTAIRLAQALAHSEKSDLITTKLLEDPLIHAEKFLTTVEAPQQNNITEVRVGDSSVLRRRSRRRRALAESNGDSV